MFLQYMGRETESSQCWADLASLTVLRELRLRRFTSAKAALLATILNIEHCDIADPPEGQVFEVSFSIAQSFQISMASLCTYSWL